MSINYILSFVVFCISSYGLSKLYQYLIKEGNLFDFMRMPLTYFQNKNEFVFKSIGGCEICNTQRFADLTYLVLTIVFYNELSWYLILFNYCMYGGFTFWLYGKDQQPQQIQDKKIVTEKIKL